MLRILCILLTTCLDPNLAYYFNGALHVHMNISCEKPDDVVLYIKHQLHIIAKRKRFSKTDLACNQVHHVIKRDNSFTNQRKGLIKKRVCRPPEMLFLRDLPESDHRVSASRNGWIIFEAADQPQLTFAWQGHTMSQSHVMYLVVGEVCLTEWLMKVLRYQFI